MRPTQMKALNPVTVTKLFVDLFVSELSFTDWANGALLEEYPVSRPSPLGLVTVSCCGK